MTVVSENLAPSTTASSWSGKLKVLYSPLWLCFLLAILSRVWLIVHTHGVMAGDEMMVGLQAEHILRGERPVYYYAQPYMGSLEAYLAALIFLSPGDDSDEPAYGLSRLAFRRSSGGNRAPVCPAENDFHDYRRPGSCLSSSL